MESTAEKEKLQCKYCNSDLVVKFGTYKGSQRYFCKNCHRKFKADNSSFHMKISSEYVNLALNMYYQGLLISDIRKHIKKNYDLNLSKSIVYSWVNKYRNLATDYYKNLKPVVSNSWILNETEVEIDAGHTVWIYDILDSNTRFLINSHIAFEHNAEEIDYSLSKACNRVNTRPEEMMVCINESNKYRNAISLLQEVFNDKIHSTQSENVNELFDRFNGMMDGKDSVHAFKYIDLFFKFVEGWWIFYNFYKKHPKLNGKTPAEEAKICYVAQKWTDLTECI